MDPLVATFCMRVGHRTLVRPLRLELDAAVSALVCLLDVPRESVAAVHDRALDLAFEIFGDGPLPIVINVATPEKTLLLLAESLRPARFVANGSSSFVRQVGSMARATESEGQVPLRSWSNAIGAQRFAPPQVDAARGISPALQNSGPAYVQGW